MTSVVENSERQFLQALKLCYSLTQHLGEPSVIPCRAITLLCEVGKDPNTLLKYNLRYSLKNQRRGHQNLSQSRSRRLFRNTVNNNRRTSFIQKALNSIDKYARSCDNWRVYNEKCSLGFGVRDHCNILSFLLNLPSSDFKAYTGNLNTTEIISELLKEWKGVDFTLSLKHSSQLVTD